jgi:hypothetical protein
MAKTVKKFLLKDRYVHQRYEFHTHYPTYFCPPDGLEMPSPYYYSPIITRGKCIDARENTAMATPPTLSDLPAVVQQLKNAVCENVSALLSSDFIIGKQGNEYVKENIHTNRASEVQGHYYTYQNYCVRPAIEVVLLQQPLEFKRLCEANHVFKNFSSVKITNNSEKIDFQDFDLSKASFKSAILGKSNVTNAKTNAADFTGCDLSQTNITQEQLDVSATYYRAKLPSYCWRYWDSTIRSELLNQFKTLKDYAEKHIPSHDSKYIKAQQLFNTYQPMLSRTGNINAKEKAAMLADLTSQETLQLFNTHRDMRFILAEIVAFVLLLGVGYLIAAAIKQKQTGHFGLFAEPKTARMSREINGVILSTSPRL